MMLSGCQVLTTPTSSSSVDSSGAASPSSKAGDPSPVAVNTSDPTTWVISASGIGPFALGANLKSVTATLAGITDTTENCPNPDAAFFDYRAISIASITNAMGDIVGVSVGNSLHTPDGSTDAARSPLGGPHSANGIGYGSTTAAIQSAYPEVVRTDYSDDNSYPLYTVKTTPGAWITFSVLATTQLVNDAGVWPGTPPPYEYCG